MIALLGSEWLRLRSRRLVWILTILALAGIVIGVGIGTAKSHQPTVAQEAAAQRAYQRDLRRCLDGKLIPERRLPPGQSLEDVCDRSVQPQNYLGGDQLELFALIDILKGTSFLLIVIGLVIGASSVGADWQSGTVTTLLTWEPRRLRLLSMRVAVVAVTVFVIAVALQMVLGLAMAAGASVRGTTIGTGGSWLGEVAGTVLRIGVMAALGSVLAVAISTVGRNTAAALGVLFVYLALVENLLRGLVPKLSRWLLSVNTVVFVDGRPGSLEGQTVVSTGRATAIVIGYAAVLLLVALALFRSRDVT